MTPKERFQKLTVPIAIGVGLVSFYLWKYGLSECLLSLLYGVLAAIPIIILLVILSKKGIIKDK